MEPTAYWAEPGPMTDLSAHADRIAALPSDPAQLRDVVNGLVLHTHWAPAYDVKLDERGATENQIRPAAQMVEALLTRADRPLAEPRAVEERIVGTCRNFTVLHTALLRAHGVPARARCGHASYFEPGRWVDHWVTEWWDADAGRWVRTDAQLDDLQREVAAIEFDPHEVPTGAFLAGGECWQAVRSGEVDGDTCGIMDLWGAWFVRSNVVRDLAALNKVELLPWDDWGVLLAAGEADDTSLHRDIDRVAALTAEAADLDALRACFAEPDYAVPATITSWVDGVPTPVELDL